MIVLKDKTINEFELVVKENHGKRVGKFALPLTFFEQGYFFHKAHKVITERLRSEGCELIVCEVSDYKGYLKIDKAEAEGYDFEDVIEDIEDNFDVDYLIFSTNQREDGYPDYNDKEAQAIYDILEEEKYKYKFKLTTKEYKALKKYCVMMRPPLKYEENVIHLYYSTDSSFYYHAFQHYVEKYKGRKAIIQTMVFDDEGVPLPSDGNFTGFYKAAGNEDLLEFSLFINGMNGMDFKALNNKAEELGGELSSRVIELHDTSIVEITYKGVSNADIVFNRIIPKS